MRITARSCPRAGPQRPHRPNGKPVNDPLPVPSRRWQNAVAFGFARTCVAAVLLLACATPLLSRQLPCQGKLHPEELQLQPEIDAAIDNGVEYLFNQQIRDGSWGMHGDFVGGRAGLCLYTLLQCGVSRNHPSVQRAVAYLDSCEPQHTYATTCMILAYDALRDGRKKRIEQLVDKLISWQRPNGMWAYPHGAPDLSCTQYAALGLWVGIKRGIKIDRKIFQKLFDGLEDFRTRVQKVDNNLAKGRTGATKVDMAGYAYRPTKDGNHKPTGSMTTAGIAVIEICKAGFGRKMSRGLRRKATDRVDAALQWMEQNFSVTKNPNGGHEHYYLYGLERIGALTNREQIGPHWWYIAGAKHLLATQNKKEGHWRGVNETCFSLLFLRRATRGHAPTTGGGSDKNRHVFSAGDKKSDIRLRGAGQQPLAMWIDGFGETLRELHSEFGIRVVSVEYLDGDGNVLGKVAGDPTKTWNNETFLYRDKAVSRGQHEIKARVTLLANDTEPGNTDPVEVIESPPMKVAIRDVIEDWMKSANASYQLNLLRGRKVEVSPSSVLNDRLPGHNLIDGHDSKKWVAAPDDKNPNVLFTWRKPITVAAIMFAPCALHDRELRNYDDFGAIEVLIGNDRDRWLRIPANADKLAPTTFLLPKPRKMRSIRFRFADRVHRNGHIGLAEFALLPPQKKQRRR